jgi:hypothetical protein
VLQGLPLQVLLVPLLGSELQGLGLPQLPPLVGWELLAVQQLALPPLLGSEI